MSRFRAKVSSMHVSFQEYRIVLNRVVSNGVESMLNRIELVLNLYWIYIESRFIVLNFNTLH